MLEIIGKKPDFRPMFKRYMDEYEKYLSAYYSRHSSSVYDMYDDDYDIDWDSYDDYDDSWINQYWEGVRNRHNKATRRGGKKGKYTPPLYEDVVKTSGKKNKTKRRYSEVATNKYDERGNNKVITFYWDVNLPDDNAETFESVFEFDKFLTDRGISVSADNVDKLLGNDFSYCCLSPVTMDGNSNELLVGDTFGDLSWKYAELYNDYIPSCAK